MSIILISDPNLGTNRRCWVSPSNLDELPFWHGSDELARPGLSGSVSCAGVLACLLACMTVSDPAAGIVGLHRIPPDQRTIVSPDSRLPFAIRLSHRDVTFGVASLSSVTRLGPPKRRDSNMLRVSRT